MGYLKINNLYKDKKILQFKQVYAMEKIHGTSTNISFDSTKSVVELYAGGCKHEEFAALFDCKELHRKIAALGFETMTIYGEGYGGKMQAMSKVYGPDLRFVAFDIRVGQRWMELEKAHKLVNSLGLEFVDYKLVSTDLEVLECEKNKPSVQAYRNGCGDNQPREGIILRPPFEVRLNNGGRLIAKHKADDFRETRKTRPIRTDKLEVLKEARAIADEWVTEMRLDHILGKIQGEVGVEKTGEIIKAMIADIEAESVGETVMSREAKNAIGKATAVMFRNRVCKL
jgi:hypothetical protein